MLARLRILWGPLLCGGIVAGSIFLPAAPAYADPSPAAPALGEAFTLGDVTVYEDRDFALLGFTDHGSPDLYGEVTAPSGATIGFFTRESVSGASGSRLRINAVYAIRTSGAGSSSEYLCSNQTAVNFSGALVPNKYMPGGSSPGQQTNGGSPLFNTDPYAIRFQSSGTLVTGSDLYFWFKAAASDCATTDPGPPPLTPILAPELACGREIDVDPAGSFVRAYATVTNPDPDATDVIEWLFPGDVAWRTNAYETWTTPALSEMPQGGWRAKCKVTRTVGAGRPGSDGWTDLDSSAEADYCDPADLDCLLDEAPVVGGYAVPPGTLPAIPVIVPPPSTGVISAPPGLVAPSTQPSLWGTLGSVAQVAGSGIVGYLAGGIISSQLDTALGMDTQWLCKWNPGYRYTSSDVCAQFDAAPYVGSVASFSLASAPATRLAPEWDTATVIADVLVDVRRPDLGARTFVAVEDSTKTPEGTDRLTETQTDEVIDLAENPEVPGVGDSECFPGGWGALNPINWVLKPVKCALVWAFVPTRSWSDLAPECVTAFPCNVGVEAVQSAEGIYDGVAGGLSGDECGPTVGFDSIGERPGFEFTLPSPASGCEHAGTDGATLFGWRTTLRGIGSVFLWLAFFRKVYRMLPWAKDEELPVPA